MKRFLVRVALDVAREEVWMLNRDERRARRQEILRRLNAKEELLGKTKARTDAADEERQRKLKDEIEWEHERTRFIRSFPMG